MSDDFFENFSKYNGDPQNTDPPKDDSISYNPYMTDQPTPEPEQTANPFADLADPLADNAEPIADAPAEPTVEKPAEPPKRDNTFAEMYRPHDAASTSRYTDPIKSADYSASDNASDGYYYRSFTKHDEPVQHRPRSTEAPKKSGSGMSKGAIAVLLIICILVSGAAGFGGSILAGSLKKGGGNTPAAPGSNTAETVADDDTKTTTKTYSVDKTTAEITDIAAPSVVEITTEVLQTSEYYGQYVQEGAGSGVIIKADGTIITNNHVIEGAKNITVTLRSGESFEAELVGTDEELDIALISIDPGDTELTVAKIGDSDTLNVGDKSVIIGNPLGTLGGSVTEGIISALDRSIVIDGKTMTLMQTDAAINAGNSGGGMFNGQGELVGIVVAKNYSGEVDNIGFVIPINAAREILEDLAEFGYVRGKPDTGMTFVDITNSLYAYYYFRSGNPGCYVASVESGSNADEAGFEVGDRIVSIEDKEISESTDVRKAIDDKSVGDTVEIQIERSGKMMTLHLTLEEKIPEGVR